MVLGGGIALKGCAGRTGKPAVALDRDAAAKRIAVMPLWRIAGRSRIIIHCGDPHVRTFSRRTGRNEEAVATKRLETLDAWRYLCLVVSSAAVTQSRDNAPASCAIWLGGSVSARLKLARNWIDGPLRLSGSIWLCAMLAPEQDQQPADLPQRHWCRVGGGCNAYGGCSARPCPRNPARLHRGGYTGLSRLPAAWGFTLSPARAGVGLGHHHCGYLGVVAG
jgi:hypothetical protein